MNYVYVLQSKKDNGFYIGYTKDLKRRFSQHNSGHSKSTKSRGPFILIYYEAFLSNTDARSREVFLKSGHGRKQLFDILKNTLKLSNKNFT
jgi:putative endonuclease